MCHYCGCRQMPLIRDFVAEHERATTLGGDAVRALDHLELAEARRLLDAMLEELLSHWQGEENGLFTMMGKEQEYADYIAPLVVEHRELEELLTTVDLGDPAGRERVRVAVAELEEHISKEEDGLFPAALIALDGSEWDAAMAAWAQAHPGEQPLGG
jgi:iron-sulfur cluster repair protein YtfE (RIC family)